MEIFDMIVMTLFVGYIFRDIFSRYSHKTPKLGFDWNSLKFAIMITAPGLILHELSHKFVAMSFGMTATFHAAYIWLIFGLIMKLLNFGFIVFVPAFVSIAGSGSNLQFALIALAGPLTNLLIWLIAAYLIKNKKIKTKHINLVVLTREINKFLFIFNMIPIPGFDGFQFLVNLFKVFF